MFWIIISEQNIRYHTIEKILFKYFIKEVIKLKIIVFEFYQSAPYKIIISTILFLIFNFEIYFSMKFNLTIFIGSYQFKSYRILILRKRSIQNNYKKHNFVLNFQL